MNLVLKKKERYSFVLSGGSTPKKLYHILADDFKDKVDWQRVDFFWGDERYVPFDDDRNNGKMAYSSLLTPLGIPEKNIYRIPVSPTPENAAKQYEEILKKYLTNESDQRFDLALQGMGADGHTLSVFPGSVLLNNQTDWVQSVYNSGDQLQRITMLPHLVSHSANIIFMVSGKEKADTLKAVIGGEYNPSLYPSQLFRNNDNVMWFLDEGSAQKLIIA